MLVLTRKCQESVLVGSDEGFDHVMKVTVLEIKNGSVKLGFDVDPAAEVRGKAIWNDFAKGIWQQAPDAVPVLIPAHKG